MLHLNILLEPIDILHFHIMRVISEQFSRRDLEPVAFLFKFKKKASMHKRHHLKPAKDVRWSFLRKYLTGCQ